MEWPAYQPLVGGEGVSWHVLVRFFSYSVCFYFSDSCWLFGCLACQSLNTMLKF